MGLTIKSKKGKKSIDLGSGGFYRLRRRLANLTDSTFGANYELLMHLYLSATSEEKTKQIQAIEEQIGKIVDEKKISYKVADFLFASDIEGKATYGTCKDLLKVIGDYDDDILYGYCGRPDCAKFADFKAILQECADLKCDMVWS